MITVRTPSGEMSIQADSWNNDGDGNLDCLKGDNVVATFPRDHWSVVYEPDSVNQ